MTKKYKRNEWHIEMDLGLDKGVTLRDFDKIVDLLGETSKHHDTFDKMDLSLKLVDNNKKTLFKLKSNNSGSMNREVTRFKNIIEKKFNL